PPKVTELSDCDLLDVGGGARVPHIPGHTHGSIAVHLPRLGVFNLDRAQAIASFHRLADLEAEVACFGHGDPVLGRASVVLRESADGYRASP
ncbi:MBL fold metallo-hydrolase, partial [Streptomyces rochei]